MKMKFFPNKQNLILAIALEILCLIAILAVLPFEGDTQKIYIVIVFCAIGLVLGGILCFDGFATITLTSTLLIYRKNIF